MLIAVLACTYAFTHSVKPQWEATAWIQIGQVGPVPPGLDPKVEPLLRVIERLQLVPFENEILESIGFASDSPEAQLYRNSLKLEPMPYAGPLVRLNVRARSPQQARQFATATVTRLQAVHRQLEVLPLKYAHEHLAQVEMDLRDALADRARLLQVAASGARGDAAGKGIAGMLLANKNEDVRNLQQARSDLMDRLGPIYTFETSMPWPVYVPERQAFPNPALMWGIGLLLGMFLAAFAATTRNVARRAASRRAASIASA
ncbi:MAG TPA: lipopolysaccharide biosynthesis protein [Rhodanobacter sp.]